MKKKNDAEIKFKVNIDDNNSESKLSKIGNVGKTAFKGIGVAIGTVSVALGTLVMKSTQMAGELEQQIGGSEAVFEKFAETVQKKGAEAYKTMGLSQNDYLATANKMGSLMQGAGLSVEKSVDLSTKAMQRAADVASVMGIDTSMAMESIAGAAKGNFTMMDNLGVAMNDTTLQAYALEKGITKSTQSMTNAEKVELAMQMFLEKTSKYAGNYAKENETFAGSFSTLKASVQNFLSGASDIQPVIDSVMNFGKILVKSIGEMAPKLVEGIVGLINGIIPQLPSLLQQLLPSVISGAIELIKGLVNSLPSLLPILMNGIVQVISGITQILPQILQALLNASILLTQSLAQQMPTLIPLIIDAILQMIPILLENLPLFIMAGVQLLVGIIQGIVQAIPKLVVMLPQIIQSIINTIISMIPQIVLLGPQILMGLATGLISAIPELIMAIPQIIMSLVNGFFSGIGQFITVGSSIIGNMWNGISSAIVGVLQKIPGFPKEILQKIQNGFSNIGNIGKNLVQGLWNGIANVKDWIISKIKGFGSSILKSIKNIFGVHSPSTEFAWIGKMNIIGLEEGMEDNIPNLNSTIDRAINLDYDTSGLDFLENGAFNISNGLSASTTSNYNNQNNIYVNVSADMDVNKFGKGFVRNIKTFSGGAKNSYNYGGGL